MGGIQVTPYRPQSENLLDQVTRIQQLKNAQQQNALQTQEVQGAQLENQQREIDLKSQQAIMKAYSDNNGDLDKTLLQASKNGAKPGDLIKLRQAGIEQQKSNLELLTAKGARALQEADLMQGAHDAVGAAPAEQKPIVYQQQLAGLQQAGVDISKTPPEYPGDRAFALMGAGIKGHKQQLEDLAKQIGIQKDVAQTGEASSRAHEADVNAAKTQQEMQLGTGPMADSKYRFLIQQQKLGRKLSPEDQAFTQAYEKQKELNTQVRVNAMGQQREYPVYDTKNKTTLMLGADAINQANRDEPGRYSVPGFTTEAQIQKKTGEAFAPGGKAGEEVLAFNTALAHADLLKQAGEALKNGNVRALNEVGNKLGVQLGSDNATNFKIISDAYTREVNKALTAGHVTDSEIKEIGSTIPSNASPAQLLGAVSSYKNLMASKVQLRKQQLEAGKQGKSTLEQSGSDKEIHYKIVNGALVAQ